MSGTPGSHGPIILALPLLACLLFSSFEIFAALKMKQLEAYGLAIAASILAILISPSSVIGLPIGIWSLVVLSRADVRAAFARRVREMATPQEKRLGIAALVLSVAAFPLALCLGSMSVTRQTVFLSFALLQVTGLICGVAGRRSVTGKFGICLSALTLILGTTVMACL